MFIESPSQMRPRSVHPLRVPCGWTGRGRGRVSQSGKWAGFFSALVLAAGLAHPSWAGAGISAQRQQELLYLLQQDCGSCHGLTMNGGLGSPLLPVNLVDKPDAALVEVIMQGLPGTPMPPWRFLLEEKEAAWLVRALKTGQTLKVSP